MKIGKTFEIIIISILAAVVLLFALQGAILLFIGFCRGNATRNSIRADEMSPMVQPGTVWQSKDGKIMLYPVEEDGETVTYVTVETESGAVELEMDLWLYGMVHFYLPTENAEGEEELTFFAEAGGRCRDYDKYVLEIYDIRSDDPILKNLFEEDEKIIFYRISVPEPVPVESMPETTVPVEPEEAPPAEQEDETPRIKKPKQFGG